MNKNTAYILFTDDTVYGIGQNDSDKTVLCLSKFDNYLDASKDITERLHEDGAVFTKCAVAIESEKCVIRNYEFPFSGKKRIQNVVDFEIQEDIPFEKGDIIHDFFVGNYRNKTSFTAVSATNKNIVKEVLSSFAALRLEVESIDTDIACFSRACINVANDIEYCVGLDVGQNRTLCCLLESGKVHKIGSIPFGESYLKQAIGVAAGVSKDEVERTLLFQDAVAQEQKEQQAIASDMLEKFCQRLVRDCLRLLPKDTSDPLFLVSGDIVRATGFREAFQKASETEVRIWEELYFAPGEEIDEGQRGSGLATVYGLIMPNGPSFNFRKDEFALVKPISTLRKDGIRYGALVLLFVLSFTLALYSQIKFKEEKVELLTNKTLQAYEKALPQVSKGLQLAQYESILSSRLDVLTGDNESKSNNIEPVIYVIREISAAIENNIDIEITNMSLDDKQITIQGETASLAAVEKIRKLLNNSNQFESVDIKNAVADKKKNIIRFDILLNR